MALVTGKPAAPSNATGASELNHALNLIAATPDPKACVAPPRGDDPYYAGVLRFIDRVVGMKNAAIGPRDIELMARLDQARACLKSSAPPKGFDEIVRQLEGKGNSSNGIAYDAKKKLILAAQDVTKAWDSLEDLFAYADRVEANRVEAREGGLWSQRSALVEHRAPAASLTPYQSNLLRAQELFIKAKDRYKAAQDRVISLTRELTNELQSQRR